MVKCIHRTTGIISEFTDWFVKTKEFRNSGWVVFDTEQGKSIANAHPDEVKRWVDNPVKTIKDDPKVESKENIDEIVAAAVAKALRNFQAAEKSEAALVGETKESDFAKKVNKKRNG